MKNWKNLCKRGLSLLVCLVMCLSMLPGVAYAKEGDDCRRAGCNGVLVAVPETPATCTEGTIKAHLTCSICGTNYHRGRWSVMYLRPVDRISDPLGHDMTYHAATEATCTIPGNVEYWSCSRCGKNFSDQAGNTEITNPTGTTNPDNHTGEQVPEHDDAGHWTEWNCCHVMVGSKEAHTYIGADCVTEGECCVCGAKGINPNAHVPADAVRKNEKAATCTEDGSYDEVVYCSECEEEISREAKTIEKKAHTYGPWTITVEPTTEAKGEAKHTCTVCGHEETVEIPQLPTSENPGDGTWTLSEEAAPTCTETGKNVYTSEYGTVEVVVPALGHDYAEAWTAGDDNHWHVCTRCDAIDGEDAHDYDDGVVTVEPTATAEGTRTYTCQTCGHSYDVAIPATGTVTPPTPPTPPAPTPGTGGGTGGTPAPTPTPGGDVNIDEEDVPLADITFEDVLPTDPFYEAVKYVFNRGLMEGVSDTEFAPQTTLNRAMLVTILYRLEGEPEAEPSTFKDVPAGKWFTDAVGWASANEVVEGYDDDHFGPLDPLTREQMAAILHRYAKYKGYDVTDAADLTAYTDADAIHEYALDAATWSVAISVLEALTETTLGPRDNATRAQVAVALMNFCEKYVPLETEGEAA